MKIETTTLLRRGNIHTKRLAIELQIAGAQDVFVSPDALSQLRRSLSFLYLKALDCPAWRRLMRARHPVPAAGVIEVLAVIAQRYNYWPVKFCSWRGVKSDDAAETDHHVQGRAIFEIGSKQPGIEAAKVAIALTEAMTEGASPKKLRELFYSGMEKFLRKTNFETPAVDALQMAREGMRRSIPWSVLHRSQYMRLGTGRHAHILKGSESTNTRSISRAVSRDKRLTHAILHEAGLPVARQRTARREQDAIAHAKDLGFPLVVKPVDGNMGKAVTIDIRDEDRLITAFHRAQKISRTVVLESMIEGDEYRLLVVNGRFVAAANRIPAQVKADGKSDVGELVRVENARPERHFIWPGRIPFMKHIEIDSEALELLGDQGLTLESVPPEGQVVFLRRESNISRGGEGFDMTDRIHPSIRDVAERAASLIGLDVCGVDFITTDPSRHWRKAGGAICEANSRPGVSWHLHLAGDRAHEITDTMLDMLYPEGTPSRLPVIALLGWPHQTGDLRRRIEAVATRANKLLGVVPSDDGKQAVLPMTRKFDDGETLSWDNQIECGVIEITPDQLAQNGAGFDRVDLALLPPPDGSEAHARAVQAMKRIAGPRVAQIDDPLAVIRALTALQLPIEAVDSFPALARETVPSTPQEATGTAEFTALFLGDVGFGESYMHRPRAAGLRETLAAHGHGYSLEKLKGLLGLADLSVANLEVPLASKPDPALDRRKKYLGWCDAPRTLAALKEAGIGAVTLANNHTLDCGTKGLSDTIIGLDDAGIASFGAGGDDKTAARPFIHRFTVGRIERSLVVFGGFEHRARYEDRYHWYADRGVAGIAQLSAERIARQIDMLRKTLPRPMFVAFPHWGVDYADVTSGQRDMAAQLVEAGVDLIIGHGTHVLQGAEMIDGCPVFYNVGNFVWNTPGRFRANGMRPYGMAAALHFKRGQRGGPSLRLYPIMTDNAVTRFQNRPVTADEFAEAARVLSDDLPRRLRPKLDGGGHHLEMKLYERSSAANTKPASASPSSRAIKTRHDAIQGEAEFGAV